MDISHQIVPEIGRRASEPYSNRHRRFWNADVVFGFDSAPCATGDCGSVRAHSPT